MAQVGWGDGRGTPVLGRETRGNVKAPGRPWESWMETEVTKFRLLQGTDSRLNLESAQADVSCVAACPTLARGCLLAAVPLTPARPAPS